MATEKQLVVKLFFNRSNMTFYVQIGDMLFPVRDKVVAAIQERTGLEIRHGNDIKEIQVMSFEEDKNKSNG